MKPIFLLTVLASFSSLVPITIVADIHKDTPERSEHFDKPAGFLLGLKVVQYDQTTPQYYYYNHVCLFKMTFDGKVSQLWNHSLGQHHTVYEENNFAVDAKNELVYLGVEDQFLALDLDTGKVKIQFPLAPPNLQYFWNYDYVPQNNAIYGVCTGNGMWNWCRIKLDKLHQQNVSVEFLYEIPNDIEEFGPTNGLYYMDKEHQSIWYVPGMNDIFYVNYSTGHLIYKLLDTLFEDRNNRHIDCIAHDYSLNRTFSLVFPGLSANQYLLGELHPVPNNETILMKLPANLRLSLTGTCSYDPKTHTIIALMADSTTFMTYSMSYSILLIDVVDLRYEIIPLPGLRKWTKTRYGYWSLTAIKFIAERGDKG